MAKETRPKDYPKLKNYQPSKFMLREYKGDKKKLSEGGTHDRDNLIALCKSCHSKIHAQQGDRWSNDKTYSY